MCNNSGLIAFLLVPYLSTKSFCFAFGTMGQLLEEIREARIIFSKTKLCVRDFRGQTDGEISPVWTKEFVRTKGRFNLV